MKAIIVNAAVFQIGWLCCVLAGANHHPWLGAWHVSHLTSGSLAKGCGARV